MNLEEIKSLLQLMLDNKLVEFEFEEEGRLIKLRRAEDRVPAPVTPFTIAASAPLAPPAAAPAPALAAPPGRPDNLIEFKSPLVGTFYRAPKPDSDSFVNVGDEVGPEKVVCIIEAMKVMNEIKAEMNGVVREILVKNGQAVEFGESLFLIEKR